MGVQVQCKLIVKNIYENQSVSNVDLGLRVHIQKFQNEGDFLFICVYHRKTFLKVGINWLEYTTKTETQEKKVSQRFITWEVVKGYALKFHYL